MFENSVGLKFKRFESIHTSLTVEEMTRKVVNSEWNALRRF